MTKFPLNPFDGQVYIDAYRTKWVYDIETDSWDNIGTALSLPLATSNNSSEGPKVGLLSAANKVYLDTIQNKTGGFKFILKPGVYVNQQDGTNTQIGGDVTLKSNSLNIICREDEACGSYNSLTFELSEAFLETLCAELVGKKGPQGDKGPAGFDGKDGVGDGPRGEQGEKGADATTPHIFTGIEVEDTETVSNQAITDIELDAPHGNLYVTKSRLNVPDDSKPAVKISTEPIFRSVNFESSDLSTYTISDPINPNNEDIDVSLVALPRKYTTNMGAVPIEAISLSKVISTIINQYNLKTDEIVKTWDAKIKDYIIGIDKTARTALAELANELVQCENTLPLEYCLTMDKCNGNTNTSTNGDTSKAGQACSLPLPMHSHSIYDTEIDASTIYLGIFCSDTTSKHLVDICVGCSLSDPGIIIVQDYECKPRDENAEYIKIKFPANPSNVMIYPKTPPGFAIQVSLPWHSPSSDINHTFSDSTSMMVNVTNIRTGWDL